MGTNYYFRKKTVDPVSIEAITDSLNNDFKALVEKYNKNLREAFSAMDLDSTCEFDDSHTFFLPDSRDTYGDIHVGKLSGGWKPLLQANEYFHSIQTLKQWYEQNKHDYNFIDEYDEIVQFDDFIREIAERNQNDDLEDHKHSKDSEGYDWTHTQFS